MRRSRRNSSSGGSSSGRSGRGWASAAISAAVFAWVHANPWDFPGLFVLGVMFAWVYEKRRSMIAPVALHATNNAVELFKLLVIMH